MANLSELREAMEKIERVQEIVYHLPYDERRSWASDTLESLYKYLEVQLSRREHTALEYMNKCAGK